MRHLLLTFTHFWVLRVGDLPELSGKLVPEPQGNSDETLHFYFVLVDYKMVNLVTLYQTLRWTASFEFILVHLKCPIW